MARHYNESAMAKVVAPLLGVLLITGVFGVVWLRSEIISTEYAIGRLESRMEEALKEKQELEANLSAVLSIREVGQRGLDLGFPDRQKVFFVLRENMELGQTASLKEGSTRGLAER